VEKLHEDGIVEKLRGIDLVENLRDKGSMEKSHEKGGVVTRAGNFYTTRENDTNTTRINR
jgi:hypothetical protein